MSTPGSEDALILMFCVDDNHSAGKPLGSGSINVNENPSELTKEAKMSR